MTQATITQSQSGATVFAGEAAVNVYRAIALASALKLYANTGMKANRMWTPTNMLSTATSITGKKYKRGEYMTAHTDLKAWADEQRGTTVNVEK